MIDASIISVLDPLRHRYHPPAPNHADHERLMAEWITRYRVRLTCAGPAAADVRAGHWHTCGARRGNPDGEATRDHKPNPADLQGHTARRNRANEPDPRS